MAEKDSEPMPERDGQQQQAHVPQGFTVHSSGLASEYAREQGWGINQDERTRTPKQKQDYDGGRDYDYGTRDFGDTAKDTSSAKPAEERNRAARPRKNAA
jgi:hypothetical protein